MLSNHCLSCLSVCLSVTLVYCRQAVGWIKMKLGVGGRPQPWPHCVRWGPSSPPLKGHSLHPLFCPCLLWPSSSMEQNATWYGGRPQPRPHCVRWGPSLPRKGHSSPHFLAYVSCGQTAGCIKMPLSTKVGLGPGHIVLDGDPALPSPQRKWGTSASQFSARPLWPNGWKDQDATWNGSRTRPRQHCIRWGPIPPKK